MLWLLAVVFNVWAGVHAQQDWDPWHAPAGRIASENGLPDARRGISLLQSTQSWKAPSKFSMSMAGDALSEGHSLLSAYRQSLQRLTAQAAAARGARSNHVSEQPVSPPVVQQPLPTMSVVPIMPVAPAEPLMLPTFSQPAATPMQPMAVTPPSLLSSSSAGSYPPLTIFPAPSSGLRTPSAKPISSTMSAFQRLVASRVHFRFGGQQKQIEQKVEAPPPTVAPAMMLPPLELPPGLSDAPDAPVGKAAAIQLADPDQSVATISDVPPPITQRNLWAPRRHPAMLPLNAAQWTVPSVPTAVLVSSASHVDAMPQPEHLLASAGVSEIAQPGVSQLATPVLPPLPAQVPMAAALPPIPPQLPAFHEPAAFVSVEDSNDAMLMHAKSSESITSRLEEVQHQMEQFRQHGRKLSDDAPHAHARPARVLSRSAVAPRQQPAMPKRQPPVLLPKFEPKPLDISPMDAAVPAQQPEAALHALVASVANNRADHMSLWDKDYAKTAEASTASAPQPPKLPKLKVKSEPAVSPDEAQPSAPKKASKPAAHKHEQQADVLPDAPSEMNLASAESASETEADSSAVAPEPAASESAEEDAPVPEAAETADAEPAAEVSAEASSSTAEGAAEGEDAKSDDEASEDSMIKRLDGEVSSFEVQQRTALSDLQGELGSSATGVSSKPPPAASLHSQADSDADQDAPPAVDSDEETSNSDAAVGQSAEEAVSEDAADLNES